LVKGCGVSLELDRALQLAQVLIMILSAQCFWTLDGRGWHSSHEEITHPLADITLFDFLFS